MDAKKQKHNTVRAAVIGYGAIGRIHCRDILKIGAKSEGKVELHAVITRSFTSQSDPKTLGLTSSTKLWGGQISPKSLASKLKGDGVNLVINTAPDAVAHSLTEALIDAQILYVIAEKAGAPTAEKLTTLRDLAKAKGVHFGVKYQKMHHPPFAKMFEKARAFKKVLRGGTSDGKTMGGGGRVQCEIFASDTNEAVVQEGRLYQLANQGGHLFSLAVALESALGVSFQRFDGISDQGTWSDSSYAAATLSTRDLRVIVRLSMTRTVSGPARDRLWLRLFETDDDVSKPKSVKTVTLSAQCESEKGWTGMWDEAFLTQMRLICNAVQNGHPISPGPVSSPMEAERVLEYASKCQKSAMDKMGLKVRASKSSSAGQRRES